MTPYKTMDEAAADEPITLAEACQTILGGRVKVATLRAEASRGKLAIFRLGKRDFTTARDVREMVRKCQEDGRRRACTSTENDANGSLETDRASSAQAALSQTVVALKRGLPHTSGRNTNRGAGRTR